MRSAACAGPGLDPTFRAVFTTDEATDFDEDARRVCAGCPVFTSCAAYARGVQHIAGIWGGRRRGQPGPVATATSSPPRPGTVRT